MKLQLHNVTGKDGLALLRSDQVDFAIGSMLDVPNDLSYEPVYSYDPMLIMPLDHPLAAKTEIRLEDLSPYGLILPPQRLTTYRLVDLIFQQRKVPYRVAIEVGGWEVIKQYVAMGLGISIVTGICIGEDGPRAPRGAQHERVFSAAQLRRRRAQGQVPQRRGARVRRPDPARPFHAPRLLGSGPLRALTRPQRERRSIVEPRRGGDHDDGDAQSPAPNTRG